MDTAIYSGLVDLAFTDEENRLGTMRQAWEYYYGKFPKPLAVIPGKLDDNVIINYSRTIVDKGVTFLFGKPVEFDLEDEQAEEWLNAALDANRFMSLLQKLAINGGVCGTAFVKLQIEVGQIYPRLIVVDPETVSVRWAADDIDKVVRYMIQYPSKDPDTGKPIGIRQVIERDGQRWRIIDQVGDLKNHTWTTTSDVLWPWSWAPIIECQNLPAPNEYWGVSDLEPDITGVNTAINFVSSNTNRIIRFHAHPKTIVVGTGAQDVRVGIDEVIHLPNPQADMRNLEMSSDLGSSLAYQRELKSAWREVTRVPAVAVGETEGIGALSGVALEILYQPLIEKTNTKRILYGDMLTELARRMLAIGGFGEDQRPSLQWPDMLPKDGLQERQTALIDEQLGVSKDTLLQKFGYDPEAEKLKKSSEGAELGEQLLGAFDDGEDNPEE